MLPKATLLKPRHLGWRGLLTLFVGSVLLSGCEGCQAGGQGTLTLCAASSFTPVMEQLQARHDLQVSVDASNRLARQVADGAPCDALVVADGRWLDFVERGTPLVGRRTLAINRLVTAVSEEGPMPAGPQELMGGDYERIAIAGDNVPAGEYAEAALRELDLWQWIEGRLIRGGNVRSVAAWIASGEVDAGFVYRTDVRSMTGLREAFAFDPGTHPAIQYEATAIAGRPNSSRAVEFLDALMEPGPDRDLLIEAGFDLP